MGGNLETYVRYIHSVYQLDYVAMLHVMSKVFTYHTHMETAILITVLIQRAATSLSFRE